MGPPVAINAANSCAAARDLKVWHNTKRREMICQVKVGYNTRRKEKTYVMLGCVMRGYVMKRCVMRENGIHGSRKGYVIK